MTRREIINTLRKYRYDPAHRYGRQGCTINNIVRMTGLTRMTILKVRDYGYFQGPADERRLSAALEMIERGEVRFIFGLNQAGKDGFQKGQERWRIEHVPRPARRPPPVDRITPVSQYRPWARCCTCQGDRFEPVVILGRPHYACRNCAGPPHWPGLGARKPDDDSERLALFEQSLREDFSLLREG
jgi:hypothetical protein